MHCQMDVDLKELEQPDVTGDSPVVKNITLEQSQILRDNATDIVEMQFSYLDFLLDSDNQIFPDQNGRHDT